LKKSLDGKRTHDRCVGVCYLDGVDIAAEMVRQGIARDCPRFSNGRYRDAELKAASAGATIGQTYRLPGYCRAR
jgi:endonuclease YncB( thermonuclease family)